jgi:glycosyltransferase involved in cell wall biosynthesis
MIALVHDWLNQLGGAEDVLEVLHRTFPHAPIFTSIYDRARMPAAWRSWDIRSTWLDRLPLIHTRHQPFMPFFAWVWAHYQIPAAHETFLSNKSAFCIGARGGPGTRHICYCLTPTRFVYDFEHYRGRESIPAASIGILRALNRTLARWETRAAQRVHRFIAISREVQSRIKQLYGRDSDLIYPPVALPPAGDLAQTRDDGYLLITSRLLPYKRIDLAIEACAKTGTPLVITGAGRDAARLQALIDRQRGANIKLMGRVDDATLTELLRNCRAFVFPGFEDFGIAPVRAMGYGKPVIAFAKGGALDTVIDGQTGVMFGAQSVDSLSEAIEKCRVVTFAPSEIRKHAERFGTDHFVEQISAAVL